jgi:hypothetical protein
MKYLAIVFSVLLCIMLNNQTSFAQSKKEVVTGSKKSQIKPKFSEMTDYGLPASTGAHELPGGKAPVSNQINPDGSVKIGTTDEIIVPSEKDNRLESERKKSKKDASQTKEKKSIR